MLVTTSRNFTTVQVIVSQESDFDFSGYIPAIKLALKLINDERSSILPNYTLEHTEIINSKVKLTNCAYYCLLHLTVYYGVF